ncbi:hypothetical protein CsSME_00013650 [Camellia sinensis var. sinensis]
MSKQLLFLSSLLLLLIFLCCPQFLLRLQHKLQFLSLHCQQHKL